MQVLCSGGFPHQVTKTYRETSLDGKGLEHWRGGPHDFFMPRVPTQNLDLGIPGVRGRKGSYLCTTALSSAGGTAAQRRGDHAGSGGERAEPLPSQSGSLALFPASGSSRCFTRSSLQPAFIVSQTAAQMLMIVQKLPRGLIGPSIPGTRPAAQGARHFMLPPVPQTAAISGQEPLARFLGRWAAACRRGTWLCNPALSFSFLLSPDPQ